MPVSHILALSLSQTSFSAAYTYMQAAYRSILENETTRFDLGLQNFPTNGKDSQEEEALYWSRGILTTLLVHPDRPRRSTRTTSRCFYTGYFNNTIIMEMGW